MACFGGNGARGVLFLPRISYALAAASSIRQGCMHVGRDAHGHDPTKGGMGVFRTPYVVGIRKLLLPFSPWH